MQPIRARNQTRTDSERSPADRRGLVLLVVMVCLLIISVAGGSALKIALTQRRQMQREQLRCQAEWLADAAVSRGAARLQNDPAYEGEAWKVSAAQLGTGHAAAVDIRVAATDEASHRREVSVVVDYPDQTDQRARASRTISVDLLAKSELQ